jgi:hypothetical protein
VPVRKFCFLPALSCVLAALAGLAVPTFYASFAQADNIVGFLAAPAAMPSSAAETGFRIKLKEQTEPLLIEASPAIVDTLRNLRVGSLIVGTGQVLPLQKKVQLDAIQTVGLKELIGTWQSSRWEVFEFRDFNKLMRYLPMENEAGDFRLRFVESFDYAVAPDRDDLYSIFITDNQKRMMVGTLRFNEGSLLLTVYDSATGLESQKISLSPLFLK